jgi:MFS family permease
MYTLEDDQETPSRVNKSESVEGPTTSNTPPGDEQNKPALVDPAAAEPLPAPQLSSNVKAVQTNRKAALAALTVACIGVFLTSLDQTVVVTALPQIIGDLQIPITQLDHAAWIVSAYLLGFVVAMPLMGRVSDIYGRRRIFLLCLTIFGIGSIFCGLAPLLGQTIDLGFLALLDGVHLHIDTSSPGLVWLIAARLLQAIGGGAIVPVSMAIVGDFYGHGRRGLALGIVGALTEAGGALGPLYGALIVEHFGWQYIFYLNVPLVMALLIAAWMLIPKGRRRREGVDWLGAVLLGGALTCLSLGLAQQGTTLGPTAPNTPAPQNNPIALALAALFLLGFVLVERRVRWPVVDLTLFRRLHFTAAALVSLFVGAALIIAMADIPIYVDTVLHGQVLDSGLALLRLTALIPVGAVLGGWLCSRITCRFTGLLGLLFMATGFFLMSRWPVQVSWTQITVSTITAGLGFGLVVAPISTTAINAIETKQAGVASAIVTALRMVGMMLGLAALTSWALAYFKNLASLYPALPASATAAQFAAWSKGYAAHLVQAAHTVYCSVFFASMVLCLIALVPALFLWGKKASLAVSAIDEEAVEDEPLHEAQTVTTLSSAADVVSAGAISLRKKKRRRIFAVAAIGLVLLLIGGGILASFMFDDDSGDASLAGDNGSPSTVNMDPTVVAGPRMIQLALDGGALTSIFVKQLNLQQGTLSNLNVVPVSHDALVLTLDLHIDAQGIHRVMPIELDAVLAIDAQHNLQLQVTHVRRDGQDAGPASAARMQSAINQLLMSAVMPALRDQLKNARLISAHTSMSIVCGRGTMMLVLLVQAPPIQGIAAQPTPVSFCFKGPVDLNKLLPH